MGDSEKRGNLVQFGDIPWEFSGNPREGDGGRIPWSRNFKYFLCFEETLISYLQDKNNKEGPNCEECGVHFISDVAWKRHLVLSTKHIVM